VPADFSVPCIERNIDARAQHRESSAFWRVWQPPSPLIWRYQKIIFMFKDHCYQFHMSWALEMSRKVDRSPWLCYCSWRQVVSSVRVVWRKHFPIRKQTKLRGLSPRANYTDRATTACRRSYCQLFADRGCQRSSWRIPTAVFSVFRPEPIIFFQVAPHLYSRGWVDPVPDPLLLRKSGRAGNRTRASGSVARKFPHPNQL
jgi:hypothetical protein